MAKLSRTQKYAELRESLTNDKETSFESKELSSYQNKLNNLTGGPNAFQTPGYQNYQRPVESDPKYTWTEFEETPIDSLVNTFKDQQNDQRLNRQSNVFNSLQETPRQNSVDYTSPNGNVNIARLEEDDYIDDLVESINLNTANSYDRQRQQVYQQQAYQQQQQMYQQPVNKPVQQQPVYQQPVYQQPVYQQPVQQQPVQQQPVYQQPVKPEAPVQQPVYQQPAFEQPARPQQPVYQQPVQQPVKPQEPVKQEVKPEAEKQTIYHGYTAPASEDIKATVESFEEFVHPTVNRPIQEIEKPIEPQEVEAIEVGNETPVSQNVNENKVSQETPADRNPYGYFEETPLNDKPLFNDDFGSHEMDHSNDVNSSYLSDTMKEVSAYNKENGEQTIGQLTNNMVNEIRHHEDAKDIQEEFVETKSEENDEEFSNTVSMEISKIMDEVSTYKNNEPQPKPQVVEEVKPEPVVEKHPVLTQTLNAPEEEENVVEIKNLNEIEAEETKTRETVSSTIPFVVTTDEDDELDDEEEGSNTILNIILIVLIIILFVVLGLIVFYILRTKGVI